MDAVSLLDPFLEVILSRNTTGPIARTALGSVEKFLHYGIIGKKKIITLDQKKIVTEQIEYRCQ